MSEYPKYLYSAEGARLVLNKEQELALDGTWCDSPAKVPMPKDEPPKAEAKPAEETLEEIESEATAFVSVEKGELLAECVRHGIDVDKRWGVKKLQEVLASK